MRIANYSIIEETDHSVVLEDVGPWDMYPTITNSAEEVVKQVAPKLLGRRLLYYDSEGELTELLVKNGEFAGFAYGE